MFKLKLFSTDVLPSLGGTVRALSQINNLMFPAFETVVYTIIIAALGAAVGYLIKIFLDWCFLKIKK